MALILNGTDGVQYNDGSLQAAAASPYVLKNRIINGDMRIDQRNAGASVTPTINSYVTVDRWQARLSTGSKYSMQQNAGSVTPPTGFTNYLGITSLSAYTVTSGDYFAIEQRIEGYNVSDLDFGKASAKTVTLSFKVRSSLTGTFGGVIGNNGFDRSYAFTYTISSANTWTDISVTIPGDTSGNWLTTNDTGMRVWFSFGVGSTYSGTAGVWTAAGLIAPTGATSVVGTNGATFYITGVQLEQNTSATPFELRLYNQELANCQRYYYRQQATTNYSFFHTGFNNNTTRQFGIFNFPQTMRGTPALETTGTFSNYAILNANGNANCTSITLDGQTTNFSAYVIADVASGLTGGQGSILRANNTTSAFLGYTAEL